MKTDVQAPLVMKSSSKVVLVAAVGVAVVVAWWWWFYVYYGYSGDKAAEIAGQVGDKFGALNTLFTGLALVGLIGTLLYQSHQSRKTGEEMAKILKSLSATTDALEKQAELTGKQIKQERDIDWNNKIEDERSLVRALQCEMEVAWQLYSSNIALNIEELDGNTPLRYKYPAPPDFFPIYKANGIRIGKLNDHLLRKDIVSTYTLAVSLLSMLEYNNALAWDEDPRFLFSRISYADRIKTIHQQLKTSRDSLVKSFEMWLSAR